MDDRWSYRDHVLSVVSSSAPMFQRVRRVVASKWGISARITRMLYQCVYLPRVLYASELWGERALDPRLRVMILRAQRKVLLAVTGAYGTTSTEACPVLAGVLPLDLEIVKRGRMARCRRRNGSVEEVRELELEAVRSWQTRWSESVKGRPLYNFLPEVEDRLRCSWLEVGHDVSQFLTEHGAFMAYLHRFAKSATDECAACGRVDTALHVVFDCAGVLDARRALIADLVRQGVPWPCEPRALVRSEGAFRAFQVFVRAAVAARGRIVGDV